MPDPHRWAFMKRNDIEDITSPGDTYMTRWRLVQTPWFGVYLHKINRPDHDRDLHDHPWDFRTLVLKGGYVEDWEPGSYTARLAARSDIHHRRTWSPGSFHRMGLTEYHSIRELFRIPTWTFVVVGKRHVQWGYMTEYGWVEADEYNRVYDE